MSKIDVIAQLQIKNNITLPVIDQDQITGGMGWVVADDTARDAIPTAARLVAMEVKVIASADAGGGTAYYSLGAGLGNGDWVEVRDASYIPTSEKGAASGVATLDSDGYVPGGQIRNLFLNDSAIYANEAARFAATTTVGNFGIQIDTGAVWIKLNNDAAPTDAADWSQLSSPGVATVNGLSGGVEIDFDALIAYGSSATQFESAVTNSAYIAGIVSGQSTNTSGIAANAAAIAALDTAGALKGLCSASTAYVVGDYVELSELSATLYRCVSNNTNQTPPNATYWVVVSDSLTVGNGLALSGSTISLGNTLTDNVTIDGNANQHNYILSNINNATLTAAFYSVLSNSTASITGTTAAYVLSDTLAFIGNLAGTVGFEIGTASTLSILGAVLNYDIDRSGAYGNRSVPDYEYVTTQLGAQALSALITTPGAGQDGFSVTWDNGSSEYTLTDITAGAPSSHTLLGTSHSDATTHVPIRGDLIVANSSPAWQALALGTSGYFLKAGATDPSWAQFLLADISNIATLAGGGLTYDTGVIKFGGTIGEATTLSVGPHLYTENFESDTTIEMTSQWNPSVSLGSYYRGITDTADSTSFSSYGILKETFFVRLYNNRPTDFQGANLNMNGVSGSEAIGWGINNGDAVGILLNKDGIKVTDAASTIGMFYGASGYTSTSDEWIPHKAYVDSLVAGWTLTGTSTLDAPTIDTDGKLLKFVSGADTILSMNLNAVAFGSTTRSVSLGVQKLLAGTDTVQDIFAYHGWRTDAAGVGFGIAQRWTMKSDTTNTREAASTYVEWLDATDASRTGKYTVSLTVNAVDEIPVWSISKDLMTLGNAGLPAANQTIQVLGSSGTGHLILTPKGAGKITTVADVDIISATNHKKLTIQGFSVNTRTLELSTENTNTAINHATAAGQLSFRHNGGTKAGISSTGLTISGGTVLTFADAVDIVFNSTTGTKIGTLASQKLAFWAAAPIIQPTTAYTAATFAANTSGIVDDTATWDGYTIGAVIGALRGVGILA